MAITGNHHHERLAHPVRCSIHAGSRPGSGLEGRLGTKKGPIVLRPIPFFVPVKVKLLQTKPNETKHVKKSSKFNLLKIFDLLDYKLSR